MGSWGTPKTVPKCLASPMGQRPLATNSSSSPNDLHSYVYIYIYAYEGGGRGHGISFHDFLNCFQLLLLVIFDGQ